MSLKLPATGYNIILAFFEFYCLLTGQMVFSSTFLARILGVLLAIAGLSYLTNNFADFLAPGIAAHFFPYILGPTPVSPIQISTIFAAVVRLQ